MIKIKRNVDSVKRAINALMSKTVKVTQNLGRNKYVSYIGTVTGVYPALFTVSPQNAFNGKTSFSYSEILCGSVKIKVV